MAVAPDAEWTSTFPSGGLFPIPAPAHWCEGGVSMAYEDKTLACAECGSSFVFTASEQEFHHQKGFANEPRRCVPCREKRKRRRESSSHLELDFRSFFCLSLSRPRF